MFHCGLATGVIDQNSTHGFRRRAEEVPSIGKCGDVLISDQFDIGFVDEPGGLQSLAWLLARHLRRSHLPQFVIDQWQQFIYRDRVAAIYLLQDFGDLGHTPDFLATLGIRRSKFALASGTML